MNTNYPAYTHQQSFAPGDNNNVNDMLDAPADGLDMGLNFAMPDVQDFTSMQSQHDKTNRRKSMPNYANMPMDMENFDPRRQSMLDFAAAGGMHSGMDAFQFNTQPGLMTGNPTFPHTTADFQNDRLAAPDLSINTQFQNPHFPSLRTPGSAYASPMHPNVSAGLQMDSSFSGSHSMSMDLNDSTLAMMGNDMGLFSRSQFAGPGVNSPMGQDLIVPMPTPHTDASATDLQALDHYGTVSLTAGSDLIPGMHSGATSREQNTPQSRPHSEQLPTPSSAHNQMSVGQVRSQKSPTVDSPYDVAVESFKQMKFPWREPSDGFPSSKDANPHTKTKFKDAYAPSGFDMLGALIRVVNRPNPQIDIGSVDLSCAFVVCDVTMDDFPIVYCSDNFQSLTGYGREVIYGQNCRFLQSPDGRVQAGAKRKYVDDSSVQYLREMIDKKQEAQVSLINYRYGGQPFMNLLTMIPIAWEPGGPIRYFIGFQVDIVEQPGAVQNKNTDGSYRVNYQRGIALPSYIFHSDVHRPHSEIGQTISKDEVSSVLASYGTPGESEISRRLWDKVLLENTDDVIHVLSLKGLFLYLSPSSNKVLEYDPSELIGTGLSGVCHPSDIVPVTRELKETTNGSSVNVVFRIRRKNSGYMWFEGHGSLHTEQGKGRKCIILVGRKRPVYTLSKSIVRESGGIGDNELWSKMSTSGMFLFVSGNVRQLLDRQPEELVGTSIQALMRPESKQNFGRMLELARTGRKAESKHEMINRRGQVLQAFTTIYPGDAVEGEKPTFMVAQTRLLKHTRSSHGQRPSMYKSREHSSGESRGSAAAAHADKSPAHPSATGANTPASHRTDSHSQPMETTVGSVGNPAQYPIGHQDQSLASDDNVFDELKTTRSTSWQYELRQMEKRNRYLAEEVQNLLASKKKRKRRKGAGQLQKDCANCHTRTTPEWRRGPSGNRDLCNSCGLRWAKQVGRVSPRNSSHNSVSDKGKKSVSPRHTQPLLPNVVGEPNQPTMTSKLAQGDKRATTQANMDSHASKLARMEASAAQGFGGGIPAKIEEAVELE